MEAFLWPMTNNDSILLNEIAQYMHAISQLKYIDLCKDHLSSCMLTMYIGILIVTACLQQTTWLTTGIYSFLYGMAVFQQTNKANYNIANVSPKI